MKKTFIALVLCLALAFIFAAPAFADGETPPTEGNAFAPTGITTEILSSSSLRIAWEINPDVSVYRIAFSESRESLETDGFIIYSPEPGENFFIKDDLEEGITYYFRVGAEYDDGSLEWSDTISAAMPVGMPSAKHVTSSLIALTYTEGFEYSMDGENWQRNNVFTGLSEYTEYLFYRRRVSGEAVGGPVSVFTLCTHSETTEERKEPTCTSDGFVKHICKLCGETVSDEKLAKTEHSYTSSPVSETEATSGHSGSKTYVCTVCGEEKTVIIPRIGCTHESYHDVVIKKATCTEKGLLAHVCNDCGYVIEIIETDMLPHEEGVEIRIEPSCIAQGAVRRFCNVCGELLSEEIIPMTEHSYSEWYTDENGDTVRHCTVCGKLEYETDQNTYTNQSASGGLVAVLGGGYVFSDTLTFAASDITSRITSVIGDSAYAKAVKAIDKTSKNNGIASIYSIALYDGENNFASAQVSIKIPASHFSGKEFLIYEIMPDGTVSPCSCAVSGGYIVFLLNSNGYYSVVDITDVGTGKLSGKTVVIIVGIAVLIFIGGACFVAYYMYSKFKREKSKEWLDDNPDMSEKP